MLVDSLVLFLTCFLAGMLVYIIPKVNDKGLKMLLVFAGSYLFSITIIHILPELFTSGLEPLSIGLFILLGFFFQYFLEFLTSGVEHGHMHHSNDEHNHSFTSNWLLMIGLSLHALLEGSLIAHPSAFHAHHHSSTLLIGIILHKMPAAFALMTVLTCEFEKKLIPVTMLILFSLMSPIGLILGDYAIPLSSSGIVLLFAFVSGNFLHISTTIFVESSPGHRWNSSKVLISILGAAIAVLAEYLM